MNLRPLPTVRYWIDAADRIVKVNEEWAIYASENDGDERVGPGIVGRSVWDSIADPTITALYRELVALARRGYSVRFAYRCDAPDFRRLFAMRMTSNKGRSLEFASTLKWQEARSTVTLLDCHQSRNSEYLRVCSWCQRVGVQDKWLPVEAAVERLGLMEADSLPALTHGICEKCNARMISSIARMWASQEGVIS